MKLLSPSKHPFMEVLLVAAIVLLVALCALLAWQAVEVPRAMFAGAHHRRVPVFSGASVATSTDTSLIRSWMTFDYVSRLYGLPADYLKSALSVADPRYPNLALDRYAREVATTSPAVASAVARAVTTYLAARQ